MRSKDLPLGIRETYAEFRERYGPRTAARYLYVVTRPEYLCRNPINGYMGSGAGKWTRKPKENHECNHQDFSHPAGH